MNQLSLFSGIGAMDLGLERAGMTTVGQVEIVPFCRQILAKHWPDVPRHDDVRTAVAWWTSQSRPHVDLCSGGFPCRDISSARTANTREGLDGAESGLWSAYADVIDAVRPRWVIVENSPEWRRWVPRVRSELHGLGYASVPLRVPAGGVGALHPRPRCLVVAHADLEGEPLRAIHAEMARLRPVPRGGGHWREPFAGAVRVADGSPRGVDGARRKAIGNAVVPQVAELVGRLVMNADQRMEMAA